MAMQTGTREGTTTREGTGDGRREHIEVEHERRGVTELLEELRDESIHLLRQEVALAKQEMSEKLARTRRNAIAIGVGAAVAYAGLVFLLLAASQALVAALLGAGFSGALWLAPLIVGVVVAVIGWALVQKGASTIKRESVTPELTQQSLQEDKQWLSEKMR